MWLRKYEEPEHACDVPSLDGWHLKDYKRVEKTRWMCPICGRVYRPRETEMGLGPVFEWVRLWPWSEKYWQRRSGIVF